MHSYHVIVHVERVGTPQRKDAKTRSVRHNILFEIDREDTAIM